MKRILQSDCIGQSIPNTPAKFVRMHPGSRMAFCAFDRYPELPRYLIECE